MADENRDIVDKVKAYKQVIQDWFPMPIEDMYLYGSYAKGSACKDSDIDVAIVVQHFEGNYFDIVPMLWRFTHKIDYRIEPIVIARDTDYAGFLDEIRRTGVQIA